MKTIDELVNSLRKANSKLYDDYAVIARLAYDNAGTDYRLRRPFPQYRHFSHGSAYSLAVSNWYADLNEVQVSAFMKVLPSFRASRDRIVRSSD